MGAESGWWRAALLERRRHAAIAIAGAFALRLGCNFGQLGAASALATQKLATGTPCTSERAKADMSPARHVHRTEGVRVAASTGLPARSTASCVPEFGQCGLAGRECCAPHRCFRQSRWYSQCGSACPRGKSWDCSSDAPSVGILVGRWGGWPPWTPLLLRTLAANPTVTFLLLSEEPPPNVDVLPPNVEHHTWTLEALLRRLQRTVGVRLRSLGASGVLANGVSAAKVNDFKPMWGEAFESELRRFEWWGYMQEDVVLGDLRSLVTPSLLGRADVICPFDAPLNSSGILMLMRNVAAIRRLWRLSADAARVLAAPSYQVFDEWWGAAKDGMPALLGREAAAGRLRLSTGPARSGAVRWLGNDQSAHLVACWRRGKLYVNAGAEGPPCLGLRNGSAAGARQEARQAVLLHLLTLKRTGALRELSPLSLRAAAAVGRATELVLTRAGFWLPVAVGMRADGAAQRQQHKQPPSQQPQHELQHREAPQQRQRQHELLSGLLGAGVELRVSSDDLARHVLQLSRQDGASPCRGKACPAPLADKMLGLPCVLSCASRQAGDGACERAVRRLRTRMCARGPVRIRAPASWAVSNV